MYDWAELHFTSALFYSEPPEQDFPWPRRDWWVPSHNHPVPCSWVPGFVWHLVFVLCHEDKREKHKRREEQKPGPSEGFSASKDLLRPGLKPWNIISLREKPLILFCACSVSTTSGALELDLIFNLCYYRVINTLMRISSAKNLE